MKPSSPGGTVVIAGTASDAHVWNLIYLELLVEEMGHAAVNLGPCVPDRVLVAECCRLRPDLIVIGSVNGHGAADGLRLGPLVRARADLAGVAMVIGGKLGIGGAPDEGARRALLGAGFDRVFGETELEAFARYLAALSPVAVP
jgi:methylaspartate mutase sigma subunit